LGFGFGGYTIEESAEPYYAIDRSVLRWQEEKTQIERVSGVLLCPSFA